MYHEFYDFKESPFNVTSDPAFFFSNKTHNDAISNLIYGIQQRKGLIVITGEIGTGKTTLCRKLLKLSDENTKFSLILNPKFSELQLLQMIIHDFGIETTKARDKFTLINTLSDYLSKAADFGHTIVLIVDEAQKLTVNQLEQLRLLSNIETEKEKLIQIILVGQPELYDKLNLPELRQFRQRVTVHFHLKPLEKNDVKEYIYNRMIKAARLADKMKQIIFTDDAIKKIYEYTKGTPRVINILCDRALLVGYVAETYLIDDKIIESCASEALYW